MTALVGVKSTDIDTYWPLIEPLLSQGLRRFEARTFEAVDILEGARNGRFQVWVGLTPYEVKAVAVTEIKMTPRAKICHVFFTTGTDRKEWSHHLAEIQKWAKSIDCTHFTAECRPGWQKDDAFKDFKHSMIIMERRL